jgi:hypothetical protein
VLRDTSSIRAISRMLLPCRLKTRISTASSVTNMWASASEYPTSGWVIFQSATLGQFYIGTNITDIRPHTAVILVMERHKYADYQ